MLLHITDDGKVKFSFTKNGLRIKGKVPVEHIAKHVIPQTWGVIMPTEIVNILRNVGGEYLVMDTVEIHLHKNEVAVKWRGTSPHIIYIQWYFPREFERLLAKSAAEYCV